MHLWTGLCLSNKSVASHILDCICERLHFFSFSFKTTVLRARWILVDVLWNQELMLLIEWACSCNHLLCPRCTSILSITTLVSVWCRIIQEVSTRSSCTSSYSVRTCVQKLLWDIRICSMLSNSSGFADSSRSVQEWIVAGIVTSIYLLDSL